MSHQQKKVEDENMEVCGEQPEKDPIDELEARWRSIRNINKYTTSGGKPKCVLRHRDRYKKGRPLKVQSMTLRNNNKNYHLAGKTLLEYANLHKTNNTKYADVAELVLLTNSTKNLLLMWGTIKIATIILKEHGKGSLLQNLLLIQEPRIDKDESASEFLNVVELHVIHRQDEMKNESDNSSSRSLDVKEMLVKKFGNQIKFCKPIGSALTTSEYVLSSEKDFVPNAINTLTTGRGIQDPMMIKSIARKESGEIMAKPAKPYPPTPQEIIVSFDSVCNNLYNLITLSQSKILS